MIQVTVATGCKITTTDGAGNIRTYVATESPWIPTADAKKFVAAGLCTLT